MGEYVTEIFPLPKHQLLFWVKSHSSDKDFISEVKENLKLNESDITILSPCDAFFPCNKYKKINDYGFKIILSSANTKEFVFNQEKIEEFLKDREYKYLLIKIKKDPWNKNAKTLDIYNAVDCALNDLKKDRLNNDLIIWLDKIVFVDFYYFYELRGQLAIRNFLPAGFLTREFFSMREVVDYWRVNLYKGKPS